MVVLDVVSVMLLSLFTGEDSVVLLILVLHKLSVV